MLPMRFSEILEPTFDFDREAIDAEALDELLKRLDANSDEMLPLVVWRIEFDSNR